MRAAARLEAARGIALPFGGSSHALAEIEVVAASLALSPAAVAGPTLDAMNGRWASGDCYDAGEWRVYGNEIEFAWPRRPVDVERVVSESGNRIETIGISREINGARYTYIVSNDRNTVWIRNHRDNIDEVVRRCGGPGRRM